MHMGLQRPRLWRLMHHLALTTVLLHGRHSVPVLPLVRDYAPSGVHSPELALTRAQDPSWFHTANWGPSQGKPRWPMWDSPAYVIRPRGSRMSTRGRASEAASTNARKLCPPLL